MPHFQYCSKIWHFCGAWNSKKPELLNKHVLRIILGDKVSTYGMLLESLDLVSLRTKRLLDMLILVHKSFQAATPADIDYISALFTPRTNINQFNGLRGINKLQLPRVNTTTYGKNSFKFLAPKLWNMMNDDLRTTTSATYFRNNGLDFVN